MNKQILKGFNTEMQKEALGPIWLTKALTKFKVWRGARAGEKSIIREGGRKATSAARTGGKDVDALGKLDDVTETVRKTRVAEGKRMINPETVSTGSGAKGFLSRNKGKLLVGGAAVGGLYLASKPNPEEEQRQKARLAMRNMNIPQKVYYQ